MLSRLNGHPFIFSICMLAAASKGYAEENGPVVQINLLSEYFIKGDYSLSYDVLVGSEIQYYFSHSQPLHHFVKSGYRASTSQSGSALELFNLDLGSRYHMGTFWGNKLFANYSVGAVYSSEEFSIQLIDREANTSFSDWALQGSVALDMELGNQLSSKLFFNQIDSKGSSAGLSVSLAF